MGPQGGKRVVLLVDDHAVVREGLRLLLETLLGLEVVQAGSGTEALAIATTRHIDVALLDARMPENDGVWTLQQIKKVKPELPVLMLSTYDTEEYVDRALESGAAGYLLKESSSQQLSEAIETALSGRGVYLHPSVAQRVLSRRQQQSERAANPLSRRELDVLQLLAAGATNDDIARTLFLSEKTVKSHLSSIFRKLAVTNRTQAAAKAIRENLVDLNA